jgi:predicted phosphodiesterase
MKYSPKNNEHLTIINKVYHEEKIKNPNMFWGRIAKRLNEMFNMEKDSEWWKNQRYKHSVKLEKSPVTPKNEYVGDMNDPELKDLASDPHKEESIIMEDDNHIKAKVVIMDDNPANITPEEFVERFNLDPNIWKMETFVAKIWNTSMKDSDENPTITTNYSTAARFRRINEVKPSESLLDWVFEYAVKQAKEQGEPFSVLKYEPIEAKIKDNVLVLPLFDAHIGKLTWEEETDTDSDIHKSIETFRTILRQLIDRAKLIGFDEIIFPIGNDYFQYDTMNNETTGKTHQDSDSRWKALFGKGIDLLVESIRYCSKFAKVNVILVQGNHDFMMSFFAYQSLRGWFDTNPRVNISKNIRTRQYVKVGVNLLGFTHGDKEKAARLFKLMPVEAKPLWSDVLFAEFLTGHGHREMLIQEDTGIRIRMISSISPRDAWHYEQGYWSLPAAQAIIYNKRMPGPLATVHAVVTFKVKQKDGDKYLIIE